MTKILKNQKTIKIIKIAIFSIISMLMIMIIIKKYIKIQKYETEEVKINIEQEERNNYPKKEGILGTIEIPSVKIKSNIYKGENEFLKYGLLHHKESYFPGDGGTILLTGNNKYLKNLSKVKEKDQIVLKTIYGEYKYVIEKTQIENAKKLEKELTISNKEELVIYTTYPEIKGYKSERFVVYAKLVGDNK